MKLTVKLLDQSSSVNDLKPISQLKIVKGSTAELWVRLVNEDTGERVIPASGSSLAISISRFPQYFPTDTNERETRDYTISGNMTQPFSADDRSIWRFPLTAVQTATLTSSAIKLTLTQGSDVKVIYVPMAISCKNAGEA